MKDKNKFTIGDRTNNGTISKFEVDTYGIRVFFEDKPKNYHVSLNSIHHIKKPLFTTEDGVDIFKNTKFWYIDNFIIKTYITREFSEIESSYKKFSTKEKAEEYILLNKPCICLKDLIEAFFPKDYNFNNRKSEGAIEDISVNLLISLFKLKLKEK